ncbi:unnamed protein product [Caenorhabditis angaria]|uniref:Saposin B-type domain-containing protein n=1 Tax=Caenorhabditis angaria TaxID=860376 RepID=A0A9P1J0U1_9PELO|nr:unnamed protein product [Caenorhabditis angaria]
MQQKLMAGLILVAVLACALAAPPQQLAKPSCSLDERGQIPCGCCKKDCWYTIAAAATHELGHMPGEAGEQETLATLRLIRACMIEECAEVCQASPSGHPARPF